MLLRKISRTIVTIGALSALFSIQAIPADAQIDDTTSLPEYCVGVAFPDWIPVAEPQTPGAIRCYPQLSAAVRDATGGSVTLPVWVDGVSLTQELLDQNTNGTSVVISVEYWNQNYNANPNRAIVYPGEAGGCTDDRGYLLHNVGSTDNDKISSSRGYSGCNSVRHFENDYWGGAVLACTPKCAFMGTMNNQTTSIKWKKI